MDDKSILGIYIAAETQENFETALGFGHGELSNLKMKCSKCTDNPFKECNAEFFSAASIEQMRCKECNTPDINQIKNLFEDFTYDKDKTNLKTFCDFDENIIDNFHEKNLRVQIKISQ